MKQTRRQFLGAAAAALALAADPLNLPIGCQLYPVRDAIGKDFEGTLRELATIGYRAVEMCSPQGYERSGFATLAKRKPGDLRHAIRSAGLSCESCHYNFRELKEHLEERISYAKGLGLKQMVVASLGLDEYSTLAEWERGAAELNVMGEKTHKAGIQLGYHNHNGEFRKINDTLIYDKILAELDPKVVKLQFQTAVISIGFEAAAYLEKYPDHYLSMHLADWSAEKNAQVAIGSGVIDWKRLFAAAGKAGLKNYFVEMDLELMRASVPYLRQLTV